MDRLCQELCQISALRCLKNFDFRLRSSEELVVIAKNIKTPPARRLENIVINPLAPASPCARESIVAPSSQLVFVLAGYSRYKIPGIWLRSSDQDAYALGHAISTTENLNLPSVERWMQYTFPAAAILSELSQHLNGDVNPFIVDFKALGAISQDERSLIVSSLLQYLKDLLASQPEFEASLWDDIVRLTELQASIILVG
ncbi:hypothetical protein J8273_6175 [Carpediemonas membranifera]|uniref:DUF7886 domain-containing protein n=1 Tax=Carpediemonas membranifera TaxID=201153 RepID=A0A8J6ASQ8_9EUKA|nr:hypothetical protein J8273_6175 [Carpediemonas membranifera]|eukprot:KAG9391415.1 hypothetical protein J8273_6175 [Carpediemonas membranifera]